MNEGAVQLKEAKTMPDGWRWVKLGEVCQFEYGTGLPEHDRRKGNVPVYGSNGIVGCHAVSITEGPAIIIGRKGSIGQAHYSDVACWPIDTTYYIDASKTSCDLPWLFFLLKWVRLDAFNRATGVPGLNRNDAYSQVIPLPPLPEQQRISAKIQELMAEVEHARTACEAQLEAAKALPQAYLRQVFESDEAREWERRRLGEVCEIVTGNTPSKNNPENYGDYLPWVKPEDLDKEMYVEDTTEHLSVLGAKQARVLPRGAIMVSCIGNLGKIAIAGCDLATNQQINSLIPKPEVDSEYLYFCRAMFQSELEKLAASTTLKIVNKSAFASITIPLPPMPEQKQIAAKLKDKIDSAEKLKLALEKQLETINALPQAILRKAFSGEL